MGKSIEAIYDDMKDLVEMAVGKEIFDNVIGQFSIESVKGRKSYFRLYMENKLSQLERRNEIIKKYNDLDLIRKYGHAYESKALDIETKEARDIKAREARDIKIREARDLAISAYCIISLCIHGWKHHKVSTNQTVNCLVKILDYIKNPKGDDPALDICKKLDTHIDNVFCATELPFLPNHKYGRFFLRYPDHEKDIWKLSEDSETIKLKRERAIFLMLYFELHGSMRPRYARECERIRSSVFFRYSQYKSQVMFNCASDEQRTRLSHSLEVAGVAKTIATQLSCNWDLVEAMALGHDLGHVPFGHQGEEQLDKCLHEAWAGRFSHSLQSVKVLNELAIHSTLYDRFGVTGLCLSRPVLEGVLKHDTDNLFNDIRRAAWRLQYNGWREALLRYEEDGKRNETEWEHGLTIGGLESQIVYWSDKIAYAGHDWDELAQSGYIDQIAASLDTLFKRMHQISHMIDGDCGNKRKQVNYRDVNEEIDIIRFIRFVTEEIRNAFVTKPTISIPIDNPDDANSNSEEKIEKNIFLALRPWDGDETVHPDDPIKPYKTYPLFHLIHGLGYIINEEIELKKIILEYLTEGEYKQILDFFSVVYNWIKITGIYPKPYKKSDDFLWVLCRYLTGIDNRIIVQALQVHLIQHSREKISSEEQKLDSNLNEAAILKICQDLFNNSVIDGLPEKAEMKEKTLRGIRDYVSEYGYIDLPDPSERSNKKAIRRCFKEHLQRQMLISMNDAVINALDNTSSFVRSYYIESPRVRAMKVKAHMIIKELFKFFMGNEDMLPIEYQQRMEYYKQNLLKTYYNDEKNTPDTNRHHLAFQYLKERLLEYEWQHGKKGRKAATANIDVHDILTNFNSWINPLQKESEKFSMPKTLEKIIQNWESSSKGDEAIDKIHSELCQHITKARVIADYIACMTDRMAEKKYNEIVSSSTTWSTSYQD